MTRRARRARPSALAFALAWLGWSGAEAQFPPLPDATPPAIAVDPPPAEIEPPDGEPVPSRATRRANPIRVRDEQGDVFHDDFESKAPTWRQEQSDATIELRGHERSARGAHDGRISERFEFRAGAGSFFYYSYPLPVKIPIVDALTASLYVRSNQPGVQLLGRVILPADVDPATGEPAFVMVASNVFDAPDRWRRLELVDFPEAVERQARILRSSTNRPIKLDGAYLEKLVVNVYGGPGPTEVFLDDLSVSPAPPAPADAPLAAPEPRPDVPGPVDTPAVDPESGTAPAGGTRVALSRNRFKKDGSDWVPTVIRAPGADVDALRRAGFDIYGARLDTDPSVLKRAVSKGFLLMPQLEPPTGARPFDGDAALAAASSFPELASVAMWNLGENLGSSPDPAVRNAELARIRGINVALRGSAERFSKLTTASVDDLHSLYATSPDNLDLMGIAPGGWGTSKDPILTLRTLIQARDLSVLENPEGLHWAEVEATPHEMAARNIWGEEPGPDWGTPRVQPEYVRMATFRALAAGYRGIVFRGDADLTRQAGRALIIEMAILNEEIDLFESIIAQGNDPIEPLRAFRPEEKIEIAGGGLGGRTPPPRAEPEPHSTIRVAGIRTRDRKGSLLVIADYAEAGQFQPPQMALNDLNVIVPSNDSARGYQISPGGVTLLNRERVPGGTKFIIPEFDTAALVVVTTDPGLVPRLEEALTRVRPLAVAMAIEQAQLQWEWVAETDGRLRYLGHEAKDSADQLRAAQKFIADARGDLEREDYAAAWSDSRRALRPLRLLMRDHWDKAFNAMYKTNRKLRGDRLVLNKGERRDLNRPMLLMSGVSCPPLVSFNTLPQAWNWIGWMRDQRFGRNLLQGGTFEDGAALQAGGWSDVSHHYDGVTAEIGTKVDATSGRLGRSLRLGVRATDPTAKGIDALAPVLGQPASAIRTPPIQVGASQFVRISVLIRFPTPPPDGAGGVVVRDSIGGEPFQYRFAAPMARYRELVMYRRAPADGLLTVTLGLAGYGEVFFDDLRIDRVEDGALANGLDPTATPPEVPLPAAVRPTTRRGIIR